MVALTAALATGVATSARAQAWPSVARDRPRAGGGDNDSAGCRDVAAGEVIGDVVDETGDFGLQLFEIPHSDDFGLIKPSAAIYALLNPGASDNFPDTGGDQPDRGVRGGGPGAGVTAR